MISNRQSLWITTVQDELRMRSSTSDAIKVANEVLEAFDKKFPEEKRAPNMKALRRAIQGQWEVSNEEEEKDRNGGGGYPVFNNGRMF